MYNILMAHEIETLKEANKKIKEEHANDLKDMAFIMEQLGNVYCHITNGRMSKPMYYSKDVIAVADDCVNELIEEAVKERLEELKGE